MRTVPKGTLLAPVRAAPSACLEREPGRAPARRRRDTRLGRHLGLHGTGGAPGVAGRRGAEELVTTASPAVFAELIAVAERHGGDVLKFRGDALLSFFAGDRHVERACGAASDMQWTIESIGSSESSVGPVSLSMSAGVHTGVCHFFLTALPHRELIVAGPAATRVFELEDLANAGEIVVSAETAASRRGRVARRGARGRARLLRRLEPGASTIEPPPYLPGDDLVRLRARLAARPSRGRERRGGAPPGDGRLREGRGDGRVARARRAGRAPAAARHTGRVRSTAPAPRTRSPGSSRTSTSARSSST